MAWRLSFGTIIAYWSCFIKFLLIFFLFTHLQTCCCCPCTFCQELRSVPLDAWDWYTSNGLFHLTTFFFIQFSPSRFEFFEVERSATEWDKTHDRPYHFCLRWIISHRAVLVYFKRKR
jgi:hypothetical protein